MKQKDELKLAITSPSKLTYIMGKAYNQSLIGFADGIINGEKRASEEWLSKYDSNTLTDVTATALGFMLDMPFFGGMGKVGGAVGKAAAKPFVDRAMIKTTEKLKGRHPRSCSKATIIKSCYKGIAGDLRYYLIRYSTWLIRLRRLCLG